MQLERRFLHSTSPSSPDDSASERSCSPTSLNRMSAMIDLKSPTSLQRMSDMIDPKSPTSLQRMSDMTDPKSPTSLQRISDMTDPKSPTSLQRMSDMTDPKSPTSLQRMSDMTDPKSPTSLQRMNDMIDPKSPTSLQRMSDMTDPKSPTSLQRMNDMIDPKSPTSLHRMSDMTDPKSLHRMSDAIDPHSLSPSPDSLLRQHPPLCRTTSGTMDRFRAPAHLQQQNDEQVLAQFFGTEQVSKLNEFKKSLADEPSTAETGKNKPLPKRPSSGGRSHPSPKSNRSSSKSPKSNHSSPKSNPADPASFDSMGPRPSRADSGKGKMDSPSQLHKQPQPQGIVNGTSEGHEVNNVVSEMQKLRLRLQQTTLQQLAEIDRQFSPKLQRTSSGQTGHARQGSLDYNPQSSHSHQGSSELFSGHTRLGSSDFSAQTGHAHLGSSDFSAQTGHARLGSSDFGAQTGHTRLGSSDFSAQTGHVRYGSSDFTAQTGHGSSAGTGKASSDVTFQQLLSGHRRQGSADHIFLHQDHRSRQHSENFVPSISFNHIRQSSLPVDPSSLVTNVRRSTSPSTLSPPSGLPYESRSLERTRSPSGSRSPTPPYQDRWSHGHVRQGSLGSVSPPPSGGGSLSPPPQSANLPGYGYQPQHQLQQSQGGDVAVRRTLTPPRDNGSSVQQPNSHRNYRQPPQPAAGGKPPQSTTGGKSPQPTAGGKPPQSTTGGKSPQPTAGGKPPQSTTGGKSPQPTAGGKPPQSTTGGKSPQPTAGGKPPQPTAGGKPILPPKPPRGSSMSGSHTTGYPKKASGANQEGSNARSGSLPKWRPGSANSGPHYSTAVIRRGKKHTEAPAKNAEDDQPAPGGGSFSSSPPPATESTYDRLARPGSYGFELDQPEHKSLLQSTTVPESASPRMTYRRLNPRPSPTVPPKNKAKGETMPNASRGDRHPKLEPKTSAPSSGDAPALIDRSAPVYPEEIQPYMTSGELKNQMFKYTPFTEKIVKRQNSGGDLHSNGRKHEKSTKAVLPAEQTWC